MKDNFLLIMRFYSGYSIEEISNLLEISIEEYLEYEDGRRTIDNDIAKRIGLIIKMKN